MDTAAVFQEAVILAEAGNRVVPAKFKLKPDGRRWDKIPCVTDWEHNATTDPHQVRRWKRLFIQHGGVGIVHAGGGTFSIDPDLHDPDANGHDSLARLIAEYDRLPECPTLLSPTGGRQLIFRRTLELMGLKGCRDHGLGPGLDVIYGFSVVPPSTYDLGTYRWEVSILDLPPPLAPDWLVDLLLAIEKDKKALVSPKSKARDPSPAGTGVDLGGKHLKVSRHHALVSFAGMLRHRGFDADEIDHSLQRFNLDRCVPPKDPAEVRAIAEDVAARYTPGTGGVRSVTPSNPVFDLQESIGAALAQSNGHPHLVSWADLGAAKPVEWVIPNMVPAKAYVMVYAPAGMGKSLVMVDWAAKASRDGLVVYACLEGQTGIRARIAAWRELDDSDPVALHFYESSLDLCSGASVGTLIAEIKDLAAEIGQPVRMIVVDTMARAIPGADENSATDSGVITAAVSRIIEETGASVVLVHHPDKAGKAPRGSSAFLAAVDTILRVKASDRRITVTVEKQKDGGEAGTVARFDRHPVELTNSDGATFTAPAVTFLGLTTESSPPQLRLTSNQQKVLGAVAVQWSESKPVTLASTHALAFPGKSKPKSSSQTVFRWALTQDILVRLDDDDYSPGQNWPTDNFPLT